MKAQQIEMDKRMTATQNPCKLCAPLGASLAFKGVKETVPLLHGSQGCATYMRRYLISHFREPVDIACSNFSEQTAVFGGGANLKIALDNIRQVFEPKMIGIATTCLSETIGDDVPMFVKQYISSGQDNLPQIVCVSTPSYHHNHIYGFHHAVCQMVRHLADRNFKTRQHLNLFSGMVSPADIRHLKQIITDFGKSAMILPDYSKTLDGALWTAYQRMPEGGADLEDIKNSADALASIEFGFFAEEIEQSAGNYLNDEFDIPVYHQGLPIGVDAADIFFETLSKIFDTPIPEKYTEQRGRLIDAYTDGHKYVMDKRAIVYGESDLVAAVCKFLLEIGVVPVLCATSDQTHRFEPLIGQMTEQAAQRIEIMTNADFADIEAKADVLNPDLLIGSSKGYKISKKLDIPLIRIGFPIHDRFGGQRVLHLGYKGTLALFDRVVNAMICRTQASSPVGYSYM